MNKQETKQSLLQIGNQLISRHGYNNTGLNDVLAAASIPKGSFYYYFESKEDFGLQVLEQFAIRGKALCDRYLNDTSLGPLARLRGYFEWHATYLESIGCSSGCLIGNLGQELADQNEVFRLQVDSLMVLIVDDIAACFAEAQQTGQIDASLDVQELAQFCYNSWQGALLRMKVTKTVTPLRTFIHTLFNVILKS